MVERGQRRKKVFQRDPLMGTFATLRVSSPFYGKRQPSVIAAVGDLKAKRSYKQAKGLIEQIAVYRLEGQLYGDREPQEWNKILQPPQLPRSRDAIEEFGWLTHGFCASADQIQHFLSLRREFGRAYLQGHYDQAARLLAQIQNSHGCSFWLAERQMMLQQSSSGFEAHKQFLSSLQQHATPLVSYIASLLSDRLEPHVTHDVFSEMMAECLNELRTEGHRTLASLIEVQASPWTHLWAADCREMLHWCNGRPIIDRYQIALKVLTYLVATSLAATDRERVIMMLDDLGACVSDHQITHIRWALNCETRSQDIDVPTAKFLDAADELVTGQYECCALSAESLLSEDPSCFDFYWLLARARSCAGYVRSPESTKKSISEDILNALGEIAENRRDLNEPLGRLMTMGMRLGDNHLGLSLFQFANKEFSADTDDDLCKYATIASKIHSFESMVSEDSDYVRSCLCHLQKAYPGHPSLELHLFSRGIIQEETLNTRALECPAAQIVRAQRIIGKADCEDVLSKVAPLLADSRLAGKHLYTLDAARLQFLTFFRLARYEDAASALVDHYIQNPNILRHVPFERLTDSVANGLCPELKSTIFWPILVFLDNGEEQDLYEAVDDFLTATAMGSPVDLLNNLDKFPAGAVRILIRDILIRRVLSRGALWASSSEEQRLLRTKLLQRLYTISLEDQAFIVAELSDLEHSKNLEEAYRNVEGPKFFMDYGDLNRDLAPLLETTFDRYAAYRAYEEKGGQLALEADLLLQLKSGNASRAEMRTDNSETLLSNLTTFTFVQYLLHSDRGVNVTLGTRIRHGALENQIKRVFGARHLLSTKDLEGNYQCDASVRRRIASCAAEEVTALESAYTSFTQDINALYENLIAVKLRIRLPAPVLAFVEQQGHPSKELALEEGLIDVSDLFSIETLERLKSMKFNACSALLAECVKVFGVVVEKCFRGVRDYFSSCVAVEVDMALRRLDESVARVLDDGPVRAALRADILSAKDGFAQDIRIIQNWFSTAARIETGIESVRQLIRTAGRVVGYASNGRLGKLREVRMEDEETQTSFGLALYEVMSLVFRNVVQHSGVTIGQEVEYEYRCSGDQRLLRVTNEVVSEEACALAIERARARLTQSFDPRVLQRSPGGTGLHRIVALLSPFAKAPVEVSVHSETGRARFTVCIGF
jgi:hypothetical protein